MTPPTPKEQADAIARLDEVLGDPTPVPVPVAEEKSTHPPLVVLDEVKAFTDDELRAFRSRFAECECVMPNMEGPGIPVPPPTKDICPNCVIRGLLDTAEYTRGLESRLAASKKAHRQALSLCEVAIAQRDNMTRRYDALAAEKRGYHDLEAAVLRRIKDAGLRRATHVVIQNETLRAEVARLKKELAVALLPESKGEGTVMG